MYALQKVPKILQSSVKFTADFF